MQPRQINPPFLPVGQANKIVENAICLAINHYFKDGPWDEKILEEQAVFDVYPDGSEVFKMGDKEMLLFGATVYKTTVEKTGGVAHLMKISHVILYDQGDNPWRPVVLAGDSFVCAVCEELICVVCEEHHTDCDCPGPHQEDEYEYKDIGETLFARRLQDD